MGENINSLVEVSVSGLYLQASSLTTIEWGCWQRCDFSFGMINALQFKTFHSFMCLLLITNWTFRAHPSALTNVGCISISNSAVSCLAPAYYFGCLIMREINKKGEKRLHSTTRAPSNTTEKRLGCAWLITRNKSFRRLTHFVPRLSRMQMREQTTHGHKKSGLKSWQMESNGP